ncbi:MAG: phospholipase D-like domain-containing protein [Promethearchaeota archaeon]
MINLFVTENDGFEGIIRNRIINTGIADVEEIFELPNIIQTTTHRNTWIKHYPSNLCPDDIELEEKLYIAPFNIKGRKIYEKIINDAEEFIYFSAESFTDVEFAMYLRRVRIEKDIEIRLLTGFTSMDFSDRIQKMFRELIADEIKLFTIEEDLHAKLIVTDKHLLIGSINLNKMNLGFNKTKLFWRENTETFFVTFDQNLIQVAKQKFEMQLTKSINMETKLAEKIQKDVSNILNKSFNVRAKKEVKDLFSKFVLMKEIEVKKDANKLARITKKLMNHYNIKTANKDIFVMAVILFYLQDRKHTLPEIDNKINRLGAIDNLNTLIEKLINSEFIEIEKDFYKINIDTLFE